MNPLLLRARGAITPLRFRILLLGAVLLLAVAPSLSPVHLGDGACHAKRYTGYEIGTCGLTRSFKALGDARVADAVRLNPVGPLFFGLVVKSFAFGLHTEFRGRDLDEDLPPALREGTLALVVAWGLVVLTVVRLLGYLEAGPGS